MAVPGRWPQPFALGSRHGVRARGIVKRNATPLDASAVGLGVSLFVQVRLENVEGALNAFEKAVVSRPEVMECYLVTGLSV